MGRQAHIARLALGRSPFEPPLRDEYGEFILGHGAIENTARGYVQQFNDSGHPINKQADAAARKLRRAQNDVLELAGVVSRENPDDERSEKIDSILVENHIGRSLERIDKPLTRGLIWWMTSLHHRLITFRSYTDQSFLAILAADFREMGPRSFYLAGLPFSALSGMVAVMRARVLRKWLQYDAYGLTLETETSFRKMASLLVIQLSRTLTDLAMFGLEWYLESFAILQTLRLVPAVLTPAKSIALPWHFNSSLPMGSLRHSMATLGMGYIWLQWYKSPFIIGYIRTLLRDFLEQCSYLVIREVATKPDRPDHLSIVVWRDKHDDSRGLQLDADHELITSLDSLRIWRGSVVYERSPRTIFTSVKRALPNFSRLWNYLTRRSALSSRDSSILDPTEAIRRICSEHYHALVVQNQSRPEEEQIEDNALRRRAVEAYLATPGRDPFFDGIDIQAMADDISTIATRTSTTTPDPRDMHLEDIPEIDSWHEQQNDVVASESSHQLIPPLVEQNGLVSQPEGAAGMGDSDDVIIGQDVPVNTDTTLAESINESFDPIVPLESLLEPLDIQIQLQPAEPPQTPVPGISRAISFQQRIPRPVRRPTEVDPDMTIVAEEIRSITQPLARKKQPRDNNSYRVTTLSNWPAELFATQFSALIASTLILPLDIYYFRLLATGFCNLPENIALVPQVLGADILPTTSWLGFRSLSTSSKVGFLSHVMLSLGFQGVANFALWRLGAKLALYTGWIFDWGEF